MLKWHKNTFLSQLLVDGDFLSLLPDSDNQGSIKSINFISIDSDNSDSTYFDDNYYIDSFTLTTINLNQTQLKKVFQLKKYWITVS